jgi:hypothetical protein
MPIVTYGINHATLLLFLEGDQHVAHTLPMGSVISVDSQHFDSNNNLISVMWGDKKGMIFVQDLRSRGEQIG